MVRIRGSTLCPQPSERTQFLVEFVKPKFCALQIEEHDEMIVRLRGSCAECLGQSAIQFIDQFTDLII